MFSPTVNAPFTWWPSRPLDGDVVVVLFDQCLCARTEFGAVVVGPPVHQVAVAVVLGALVVETVPDLVADDRADTAVVGGVVGLGVEERRLQNRCGKDDFVHARVVVGVDGLRRHEPLVAVHRVAQLGQLAVVAHRVAAPVVAVQVVALDHQLRVVPPRLRVADLRGELVQLGQRALAGLRRHPVQVGDADPVRLAQVGHQLVHPGLGLRREVPLDVELAHRVAHQVLHHRHRTLPAVADLLGAAQRAAVEREVLGHQLVGEQEGAGVDQPPPGPALPVVEILARPQRRERASGNRAGAPPARRPTPVRCPAP